ncbi:MAG: DeoR family transcriptional regulator [Kiloniellales bacterium]|nr:DeoR family transcriptional regulator [Kiloniellales bacterium]
MAALNPRQEKILSLVREKGFVAIEALAQRFDVTAQTVRRDINELCDKALLQRYHGGAGLPSSVENIAYATRKVIFSEEKQRIARAVAREVPDHASLMINVGTTTEAVARALVGHTGLRVVTNNMNVAYTLAEKPDFEVIVTGGRLRNRDRAVVDQGSIEMIRSFRVDIAIIGISGIDLDGTLLDFDRQEVHIAQSIMESARRVFLAADHSKFGREAMVRLGHISEIDALFTDRAPPEDVAALIPSWGVALHLADAS